MVSCHVSGLHCVKYQEWECCSYHGTTSQIHYSMQMRRRLLDNHGLSTTYTTGDSTRMAADGLDQHTPLLARCRSPDHPDGPDKKKSTQFPNTVTSSCYRSRCVSHSILYLALGHTRTQKKVKLSLQ
jgi:hypothetical protein